MDVTGCDIELLMLLCMTEESCLKPPAFLIHSIFLIILRDSLAIPSVSSITSDNFYPKWPCHSKLISHF